MTSTRSFSGLAATRTGQTQQLDRTFKNMARKLKQRKSDEPVSEYDALASLSSHKLRMLVIELRQQLADKQALIDEMRTHSNSDPVDVTQAAVEYWDTSTVARKSNVSISTICRNAEALGGKKMGGDWLFPSGTTYGKRRKSK